MEQFYFQSNSPIQDLFGEATAGGVTGEVTGANYFGNLYGNSYGAVGNSSNTNGIANTATNPGAASATMSANSMGISAGEFDIPHYDVTFKDNINLHAKLGPSVIKEHQEQLQQQFNQLYHQNAHLTQKRLVISPVVVANASSLSNDYTFHQSPGYGGVQATPPTLPLTQLMAAYNEKPFMFDAPQGMFDIEHEQVGHSHDIQHNSHHHHHHEHDHEHDVQHDGFFNQIYPLPQIDEERHRGYGMLLGSQGGISRAHSGSHLSTNLSSRSQMSSQTGSHLNSQLGSLSGSITGLSGLGNPKVKSLLPLKQRLYEKFSAKDVKSIRFVEAESSCSHCEVRFNNYVDLVDHYSAHATVSLNTRNHTCPVDLCPMQIIGFDKRANLRHHVVTHHFSKGYILPEDAVYSKELQQLIYTCEDQLCGKGFYRRDSLTRHIKLVHHNQQSQFNMKLRRGSEESLRRKRKRNRY
jgi:hypothetical protein